MGHPTNQLLQIYAGMQLLEFIFESLQMIINDENEIKTHPVFPAEWSFNPGGELKKTETFEDDYYNDYVLTEFYDYVDGNK